MTSDEPPRLQTEVARLLAELDPTSRALAKYALGLDWRARRRGGARSGVLLVSPRSDRVVMELMPVRQWNQAKLKTHWTKARTYGNPLLVAAELGREMARNEAEQQQPEQQQPDPQPEPEPDPDPPATDPAARPEGARPMGHPYIKHKVLAYMQAHPDQSLWVAEVAEALGVEVKSVISAFSGLLRGDVDGSRAHLERIAELAGHKYVWHSAPYGEAAAPAAPRSATPVSGSAEQSQTAEPAEPAETAAPAHTPNGRVVLKEGDLLEVYKVIQGLMIAQLADGQKYLITLDKL